MRSKYSKKILISIIRIYQLSISPDHSFFKIFFTHRVCRYTPTCSDYAIESLEINGLRSIPAITKRVLSCNPFSAGGYDPAIKISKKNKHQLSYSPYKLLKPNK